MKIDEAISLLKQYIDYNNPDIPDFYTMAEACEVVIKALEQEPCEDCISREAVENAIKHAEINFTVNSDIDFTKHKREVQEIVNGIVDAQIKALKALPSVTPQPKMGHWSHDGSHWENRWICSECGYKLFDEQTRFCPNCGAKMQEVEE